MHESGFPHHSVLYMCDSPHHKTKNVLIRILEPLHKLVANRNVKDVSNSVYKGGYMNPNRKFMLLLDLGCLFTNVLLYATIDF